MHGLTDCIKFTRIVAIDLGKFNSVVCFYDPATTHHSFVTIQTIPQTVHDFLAEHAGEDPSQVLVVFETCDCGGWVYDVATALGFVVAIANPLHEAWRWTKVKRKTDRDDALKLASMAAIVALARKLLVKLWAMLRDGSGWIDPDRPPEKHADGGVPPAGVRCSPPEDTGRVTAVSSVVGAIG
jgi:hypothetical protein